MGASLLEKEISFGNGLVGHKGFEVLKDKVEDKDKIRGFEGWVIRWEDLRKGEGF